MLLLIIERIQEKQEGQVQVVQDMSQVCCYKTQYEMAYNIYIRYKQSRNAEQTTRSKVDEKLLKEGWN
jgi:hypothetical protein